MLWDASTIIGCTIRGRDGDGGTVTDLLFEDASWHMRWIVVNVHHWSCREVLLSVSYVQQPDVVGRRIVVDLTIQEISDSLAADLRPPVSRPSGHGGGDPHLRSVDAVIGHRVHLTDGVIGHVEDLLVQDADWGIRFLRVDTCKWRPGERLLLAPGSIREIDWDGRLVRFALGRGEIEADRAHRDVIWMRNRAEGSRLDA
ncbi:MAG: PRC-barrel domain-containing protein [Proteobacteria bacterium]|nr:PRC-barrel domain-containing protein [Pseudomonadota bacterium]